MKPYIRLVLLVLVAWACVLTLIHVALCSETFGIVVEENGKEKEIRLYGPNGSPFLDDFEAMTTDVNSLEILAYGKPKSQAKRKLWEGTLERPDRKLWAVWSRGNNETDRITILKEPREGTRPSSVFVFYHKDESLDLTPQIAACILRAHSVARGEYYILEVTAEPKPSFDAIGVFVKGRARLEPRIAIFAFTE